MNELAIGIYGTIGMLLMVFLGVRVYAAAAIAGLFGCVAILGWDAGAGIVGTIPHSKAVNYALSVLPMFILIGFIAYHAGLTHALFFAARAWFGWVPGGLAVATVFATAGQASPRSRGRARRRPRCSAGWRSRICCRTATVHDYPPASWLRAVRWRR
jgi:TRAP-type mannitol/chloroaromatic compound transport system permease large subunit